MKDGKYQVKHMNCAGGATLVPIVRGRLSHEYAHGLTNARSCPLGTKVTSPLILYATTDVFNSVFTKDDYVNSSLYLDVTINIYNRNICFVGPYS